MSYHDQASDLYTPNTTINLVAPLAIPLTADAAPIALSAIDMNHFQHPFISLQGRDPFMKPDSFSPSTVVLQDSYYDPPDDRKYVLRIPLILDSEIGGSFVVLDLMSHFTQLQL
jgi:hypothetical protein